MNYPSLFISQSGDSSADKNTFRSLKPLSQRKLSIFDRFVACTLMLLVFNVLFLSRIAQAQEMSQKSFDALMDTYLAEDSNVEKIGTALERLIQKRQKEYMERRAAEEKKQVEEQFENPVKIDIENSPFKGPKDAKVTIVEFSDFQCPYCRRGAAVMDEVIKTYPKDVVKLVFKNFPLQGHPEARPAAVAALAAGKQGKFWEMHDLLFDNQANLGSDSYQKFASQLELDMTAFNEDLKDPLIQKVVNNDYKQAIELGLQGTPGFYVNGVFVNGAKAPEFFKDLIDKWLKKLESGK